MENLLPEYDELGFLVFTARKNDQFKKGHFSEVNSSFPELHETQQSRSGSLSAENRKQALH